MSSPPEPVPAPRGAARPPAAPWQLALLLACLGMIGPFAIDTYLPAFDGIARSLQASPVQLQQTLSAYLLAFAVANLFHGALADSLGRRPVVLGGVLLFALASVGCALAQSIEQLVLCRALQGLCAGVGMVISRAIIRDLFEPAQAQRVMAQVTIFFGVAPAVAPLIGGWLYVVADWHAIFWLLAVLGVVLALAVARWLPETLTPAARQPFAPLPLLRGYVTLLRNRRLLALVLASGVPFNGMFLYVLAAPTFLGDHLRLAPTQYFLFFVCSIGGMMSGAALSGRLAGRIAPHRQVRHGFAVMATAALLNLVLSVAVAPSPWVHIAPVAMFSLGWALMVPVVNLLVLDEAPERRGTASSVQSGVSSLFNAVVAGLVTPWVMGSLAGLAATSAVCLVVGLGAWWWVRPRLRHAALVATAPTR